MKSIFVSYASADITHVNSLIAKSSEIFPDNLDLWISFQKQGSEIADIKNLTYILCNADSDFTETVLHLEEVEELSDKFIDLS